MSLDTKRWSVAVTGGQPELVTNDFDTAALSPDGKVAALLRLEGGVESVWLSSRPGAPLRKYSPAPFAKTEIFKFSAIRFSPDRSTLPNSARGALDQGAAHMTRL